MDQKKVLLDLLKNLVSKFFLNLSYNESLFYLLYHCANPILGENLFPEIWGKMFSASQVAEFLNQIYTRNKLMKCPGFLHADTNS